MSFPHWKVGAFSSAGMLLLGLGACQTPQAVAREQGMSKYYAALDKPPSEQRVALFREAASLLDKAQERERRAMALYWIAVTEREQEHYRRALDAVRQVLGGPETESELLAPLRLLWMVGDLQRHLGQYAEARVAFEESKRMAREEGDDWNEWRAIFGLAKVHAELGDSEQARAAFAEAHAVIVRTHNLRAVSSTWLARGELEAAQGRVEVARECLSNALAGHLRELQEWEAQPDRKGFAFHWEQVRRAATQVLIASARLEHQAGDWESAQRQAQRGLEMVEALPRDSPKSWETRFNRKLYEEVLALREEVSVASSREPADRPQSSIGKAPRAE